MTLGTDERRKEGCVWQMQYLILEEVERERHVNLIHSGFGKGSS